MRHTLSQIKLTPYNDLNTLVENRSVFTLEHCELNVYETHKASENVALKFNDFVFTSMLRGKKIMHLPGRDKFEYYPGESVLASPGEMMYIDFPEANEATPTQCIALSIGKDMISNTIALLNERFPRAEDKDEWNISEEQFYLLNNQELARSINNVMQLAMSNSHVKDTLAGLALKDLLVRLMQTQARKLFEENYSFLATSHRFAHVIAFIKDNIYEQITVDQLSRLAYMSKPNFFRRFKQEFGLSPVEYILRERIKFAKRLLTQNATTIADTAYHSGFNNVNYFIRVFKALEGITPKHFQQSVFNRFS